MTASWVCIQKASNSKMLTSVNKRSKAGAQEDRQISGSKSSAAAKQSRRSRRKGPKSPGEKCCLFLMMITPMLLVLLLVHFLRYYNEAVAYEQSQANLRRGVTPEKVGNPIDKLNGAVESSSRSSEDEDESKIRGYTDMQTTGSSDEEDRDEEKAVLGGDSSGGNSNMKESLVLATDLGDIRIILRPDLSSESVKYIHQLVAAGCERCKLYRAEQRGILQGIMANESVPPNKVKGKCPPEAATEDVGECPKWDPTCACHGPIMTRGSVGWAAGTPGGPDFFIDNYKSPAKWWGTQHTNFGFIEDKDSLQVVARIFDLPTRKAGLTFLKDEIHFQIRLES
eukprot:scaffold22560_cov135-Cylindrotheca_fusiformis.AAC.38